MRIARVVFVGVWMVVTALPATAGLQALRHQAQQGIPKAELQLGELYQYGVGRPDHNIWALAWYERAAPQVAHAAVLAARLKRQMSAQAVRKAMILAHVSFAPKSVVAAPHPLSAH